MHSRPFSASNVRLLLSAAFLLPRLLLAQTVTPARADQAAETVKLDRFTVLGDTTPASAASPQTLASVAADRIAETINIVDTEDAVKYLPSLFIRKRNYGDTQPTMATRTWGVSSSARSLVYADGVLLTALVANNNTLGAPRWGLVAPNEIARIDVLYGPFSAAYPGNSMGAVMEITTRLPAGFESTLDQTTAWQSFDLYGTHHTFRTEQSAVIVGHRVGKLALRVSANHQDSYSQPLSFVTSSTFPSGTTGGYAALNKTGAAANVVGAGGLLHTRMTNAKLKAAYDFTPAVRATYTFGYWRNDADSTVETYLTNAAGQPTYAGLAGFASGYYQLRQAHSAHSFDVKANPGDDWQFVATASLYHIDTDRQNSPTSASASDASFGPAGRVARLDGTGWTTVDLKATWQPGGGNSAHALSFGAHDDREELHNPTYNTSAWAVGGPYTSVATEGDGKTWTQALFTQDEWRISPRVKATAGLRYEAWRAYDGLNLSGTTLVRQPKVSATRFSPKAALAWTVAPGWTITGSVGRAYRFATVAELYQLVSTGTTFTAPNPGLKPDNVLATELKLERVFDRGSLRVSLFQDDVHDAIISQFMPLVPGSSQLYSYLANVDHVRARGVEFLVRKTDVLIRGLEWSGSVTYLDARTLALSGRASATASADAAVGKRLPNIPDWRASFVATYRPSERWSFTVGGRYSGMLWTTLDNTDVNPNAYQGFAPWFVADARVNARLDRHWQASLGVDNALNRKYFLFHPFPQRTVVAELKYAF